MSAAILVVSDWERLRAMDCSPVKDGEAKSHALRVDCTCTVSQVVMPVAPELAGD